MTVCLMKCLRCVWSDSSKAYFTLLLAILLFQYQPEGYLNNLSPTAKRHSPFLLDFFLSSILTLKLTELYLKCQFVITYIAPHQINWGSAFHAFAQPFSVPHSAMLFLQARLSSLPPLTLCWEAPSSSAHMFDQSNFGRGTTTQRGQITVIQGLRVSLKSEIRELMTTTLTQYSTSTSQGLCSTVLLET